MDIDGEIAGSVLPDLSGCLPGFGKFLLCQPSVLGNKLLAEVPFG